MRVLCIAAKYIPTAITHGTGFWNIPFAAILPQDKTCWIERSNAEKNILFKHIIPYVLCMNTQNRLACYIRCGSEKRLAGLYSCGIGGHAEEIDKAATLQKTIENGLYRELTEEISNFNKLKIELEYLGVIHENKTEAGLVHVGIVYLCRCSSDILPEPAQELGNLQWKSLHEIKELRTELWTGLALSLLEQHKQI